MKPSERKALFNTLDIIAKIDYNSFIMHHLSESKTTDPNELSKAMLSRLRSTVRYKKMLGYDTKNEQKTINEIKKLL